MLSLKVFFILTDFFSKLKIVNVNGAGSLRLSRNYRAIDYAPGIVVKGTPDSGQGGSLWTLTQKMHFLKEFFDQTRYISRLL